MLNSDSGLNSLPDFALLYYQTLEMLKKEKLVTLSTKESAVLGMIIALEKNNSIQSNQEIPGDRLLDEIDDWDIPKWVMLLTWLHPYSLSSKCPDLVCRVAKYLLGYTRKQEEDILPPGLREHLGLK